MRSTCQNKCSNNNSRDHISPIKQAFYQGSFLHHYRTKTAVGIICKMHCSYSSRLCHTYCKHQEHRQWANGRTSMCMLPFKSCIILSWTFIASDSALLGTSLGTLYPPAVFVRVPSVEGLLCFKTEVHYDLFKGK